MGRRAVGSIGAETDLGGDDQTLAVLALQPAPEDLLGHATAVDVGGVDEIAARLDEAVEDPPAQLLAAFTPEGHGAETKLADLEAGPSEGTVFHGETSS